MVVRSARYIVVVLALVAAPVLGQSAIEWMPVGEALPVLAWPMTVHGDTVFVASQDGSMMYVSTDHGLAWQERPAQGLENLDWDWITTADGAHFVTQYGPPDYEFGILRSTDGGRTWTAESIVGAHPETGFIYDLLVTQNGSLLAGTTYSTGMPLLGEILRSAEGQTPWQPAHVPSSTGSTKSVAQAPDGAVYSGHAGGIEGGWPGVLRSLNDGETWERVFDASLDVSSLEALPDGTVWAVVDGALYRSNDGMNWAPSAGAPDYFTALYAWRDCLVGFPRWFLPSGPPQHSCDSGTTWTAIADGLKGSSLSEIEADSDGFLYALVDGRLFRTTTPLPVATEPEASPPDGLTLAVPEPNPATVSTRIAFTLARPGPVAVRVFDLLGRQVAVLGQGDYAAGAHAVTWEVASIPSGVYLVQLQADGQPLSQRLVVAR